MLPTLSAIVFFAAVSLAQGPRGGQVSGQVTDAASRAPIAGARVTLILVIEGQFGSFGRQPQQTVTDTNGRFVFTGLSDGRYSLSVERNGFGPYPDVLGDGPPNPLDVSAGQSSDLHISLTKSAVLAGRLIDGAGESMPDMRVSALRRTTMAGPVDFVQFGKGGETNDLGEFRIAGLPPGEYLLVAAQSQPDRGPIAPAATAFVPTYYPGTTERNAARRLMLTSGQTVSGLQFTMETAPAVHVSGTVVDEAGHPQADAMVMMMQAPRADAPFTPMMRPAGQDGTFRFDAVAPGTYRILANLGSQGGGFIGAVAFSTGGADLTSTPDRSATQPMQVTVGDKDVDGLRIVLPNRK